MSRQWPWLRAALGMSAANWLNISKMSMPVATSMTAWASGLPTSLDSSAANSGACSRRTWAICRNRAARSRATSRLHGPKARCAASTACATSAGPQPATSARTAPVAGSSTWKTWSSLLLAHGVVTVVGAGRVLVIVPPRMCDGGGC